MAEKMMDVLMNPTRQRIAQYLIINKTGTTKEIGEELSDIPPASLYRHIKTLLDANLIEVVEKTKKRGTTEKRYSLVQNPMANPTNKEIESLIQSGLMSISATFAKYFAKGEVDPQKDLLSLSTSTLLLSDEELMEMFQKIGNVFNEVIGNKPSENRKARRITFISSPCEE